MSLVYSNGKLIGRCESFYVDEVQGASPFLMLSDFGPKQAELAEIQEKHLEILKNLLTERGDVATTIYWWMEDALGGYDMLSDESVTKIIAEFTSWALANKKYKRKGKK